MNRAVIAALFGITFPVVYTLIAVLLTAVFPNYFSDQMIWDGEYLPGLILAPVFFTAYLDVMLKAHFFHLWVLTIDHIILRIFWLIMPVFTSYSVIGYFALRMIGYPKLKPEVGSSKPPPPPIKF